jgi:molecular chaperone GrpE
MSDTPRDAATAEEQMMQTVEELAEREEQLQTAQTERDALSARLEELEQERDSLDDRLKRQAAEYQNFRRRTEEDKAKWTNDAKASVLKALLDVFDDLDRTREATAQAEGEAALQALREGVDLVNKKFGETLDRLGVVAISAEGEPFDEHLHEALTQQPAPDGVEPGTVLIEYQKGYTLGERVLRHSKVVVAS